MILMIITSGIDLYMSEVSIEKDDGLSVNLEVNDI